MGEWHRNNPELAEEISRLPPSEQLAAERAAMVDPLEVADQQRKEARESPPVAVCAQCTGRGWIFHDRAGMRQCPRCDGSGAP